LEFLDFLLDWQHVSAATQLRGRDGVLKVIEQLQGLELPAPAWEQHVLPARINGYDGADLEHLCLAGIVAWGRLRAAGEVPELVPVGTPRKKVRRLLAPARNAPIAFLLRDEIDAFVEHQTLRFDQIETLPPIALEVARYLDQHGASFLNDIARGTGLLRGKIEAVLWQLVAHGLATGDGIAGLRVLLTPEHKRVERKHRLRVIAGGRSPERTMPVGRWSLWRQLSSKESMSGDALIERHARQLLERYGIVFRDLLARESAMPSWRSLLGTYRRLEARGEIRGGRFVDGFVGEQFALPNAIETLRAKRRQSGVVSSHAAVILAAADPLNLLGIVTPGARLSPYSNQAIAYRPGVAPETGLLGELISRLQEVPRPQQG
jgi:ATP-dependent Lhr-like helicase